MDPVEQPQLFGRTAELKILQERFSNAILNSTSRSHWILLEGPPGAGKRALAKTLQPRVQEIGGLFLSGRSPPPIPDNDDRMLNAAINDSFAAFREAFKGIDDSMDETGKQLLHEALASTFSNPEDRLALMDLFGPSTSRILLPAFASASTTSDGPSLLPHRMKSTTSTEKLCETIVLFLHTVAQCRPTVILLERMDFTNELNMEILGALVWNDSESHRLLVVTTSQNSSSKHIQKLLNRDDDNLHTRSFGLSGVKFLQLPPLSREDVFNWTFEYAESIHCGKEKILSVANVIYEKSLGNPRLMRYLMCYLSLKTGDKPLTDETLDTVRSNNADSTNELFANIMQRQIAPVRAAVELVAALAECGEQEIDCKLVDMLLQCPTSKDDLQIALNSDMLTIVHGAVRFPCPELQAVAYSMIPERDRPLFHLKIGRDVWEHSHLFTERKDTDKFFGVLRLISQNLQRGLSCVSDVGELDVIGTINLRAGKIAMQSSQFSAASLF